MSFFTYRKIILSSLLLSAVLVSACSDAYRAEDPDETITVSGQVIDQANSQPVVSALVKITSPEEFQQSTTTDSTGHYSFTLQSKESVTLTIEASKADFETTTQNLTATPGSDLTTVNLALADSSDESDGEGTNEGKGAAGIFLETTPPQAINIAQTGEAISTSFNFQVQDSAGNALNSANSVLVTFKLLSSPGGEEELIPKEVETNEQGQASTTLYSGNKAGEVKVQAIVESLDGITMKSTPISIAIHGGFPDLEHFSLSRSKKNIEGINIDGNRSQISATIGDEFSNPVKPGSIVYFESNAGIIQGSARTDADGQATVDLISSNPRPDNGIATVTASTINKNDERIKRTVDVVFSSSEATIQANPTSFDLSPGESKEFNVTVTDIHGNPMAEGTQISISGSEGLSLTGDTDITLRDHLSGGSGVTDFKFSARNTREGSEDRPDTGIDIRVTAPSGQTTDYNKIKGTLRGVQGALPPGPAAIELSELPSESINITATGENVSTPITFLVRDSAGNALSAQRTAEVQFTLSSSPGGEERLVPTSAITSEQGTAQTTLYSGNQAGVVQVQASLVIDGTTVKSEPVSVSIHGGFPDAEFFNMSTSQQNIDASTTADLPTINVSLGDKFSNPVKPGTSVSFKTSGGIIQGSAQTDADGQASVRLVDLKPRPSNGKVTVTATTVGENNQSIQQTIPLIFSTSAASVSTTPTDFEIRQNGTQQFSFSITDQNGNPMAEGTQISVSGSEGLTLSGDTDITLGDYLNGGSDKTEFSFSARDDNSSENKDVKLTITVTSPTGQKTVQEINGIRIIEGSEQVGAAAIVLKQEPEDFININETGDDVSAPLTFEVRDSLGRPLTQENAVEVEFELISSPGGGEDLVPSTATTNGSGQVTTTLFSGNRAGEVKVQATVNRPEIGLSINSKPVLIAIHGGFPDKDHFSIAPDKNNFEAYNINNNRNTITVVLGDKFSNPVKPGTVVYFETTGGIIQGSAKTDEDGVAEVQLISGDPRPANGKIEVTASTVNESDIRIQKTIPLIMGTTGAIISSNKTTFDIPPNGGTSFEYEVTDLNGNPMPAGTQITIDAGEGIEVSGDANFTLGDYITTGPGKTEFKFSIRDTDDESNDAADLTILIKVTAPSGNSTIYSEISGTRHGIQ